MCIKRTGVHVQTPSGLVLIICLLHFSNAYIYPSVFSFSLSGWKERGGFGFC